MAINQQVDYYCDVCGEGDRVSDVNVTFIKRLLRRWGWSVGKRLVCPECRK